MDFREFHSKQLSFYQFWCIYLSKNSYREKNSNWWLFLGPALHLFYLVALLALCTIYENMIFAKGDPVSKFVDIIQLVFPIAIHLIVILEGLIKSKFDYRMWEIINRLEDGFAEQNISLAKINLKMKTRYLLSMGLICFIPLAVEIDIIATITESPDWMRHWFARIFSFQFTRIAIFHYLLTVDYISSRLQALGDELISLRDYCLMNQLDVVDSVVFNRLKFIKRSHLDLWLLCSHHSHRHSMFLLSLITSFFVCLTVDFYWIYANLYYGDNIFEIQSFLCAIPPILTILTIFVHCEGMTRLANNIGHPLHALQRSCNDQHTCTLIFQFSLQILQNPFYLSGMAFFQLNFDLLQTMIASITTYMVIFISFLPPKSIFPDYSEMDKLF